MTDRPAAGRTTHARRCEPTSPLLSTPARAALLLGASAAVYAVTLAGVSGWQAETSAAAAAARAARFDAVTRARAANDAMASTLRELDARTRTLVEGYDATGDDAAAYQARVDELAALVAEVEGTAASLPRRIQLPAVALHGAVSGSRRASRAPVTRARTGASGG